MNMLLEQSLIEEVAARLMDRRETLALAESTTGGLVSAALLAIPGASAFYKGGTMIYTRQARRVFLGIGAADVERIAPMSEEMARVFGNAVRMKLTADWALAELGIAGPTGSPYGIEAGTCVVAVCGPNSSSALLRTGSADRVANMVSFGNHALSVLLGALNSVD